MGCKRGSSTEVGVKTEKRHVKSDSLGHQKVWSKTHRSRSQKENHKKKSHVSNSCFRNTHSSCRGDRGRDRSRDPSSSGQINLRSVNLSGGLLAGAIPRDVASLAALVASLASSAERTSVGSRAVPRDMTELATSVTLHGLCLAVASKVVRTTALVACGRAGTSTIPATAVTTETTPADGASTTHTNASGVRASTLCNSISDRHLGGDQAVHVGERALYSQPSGQAAHSCSTDRHRHRSTAGLGSRPERDPVLDSGSTVWPQSSGEEGTGSTRVQAACSCSRGAQLKSKPRRSGQRCHICSRHGERATTS